VYCTDSDDASCVPADLRYLSSPFPAGRRARGLGASSATQATEGITAVSSGVTAAGLIAAGAAAGSVVPVLGTAIGALVGLAASLFGGGGTPDTTKAIWSVVPFSLIRLSGGHGTWTDTLTGVTMNDAGSDLRKSAVVASAINAFNDTNNHWYDATTQQYIDGSTATARWHTVFGNADFATAYAQYPNLFRIFGPTTQGDPTPHAPNPAIAAAAVPPVLTSASVTPGQLVAAGSTPSAAPLQASLLGGVSNTTLALLAVGLIGAIAFSRRRPAPRSED
jgi:hypothetical protein